MKITTRDESQGMLLGFLGVTVFGLTLPVTRFVVPFLGPAFVGLGRAVVAGGVAIMLLWVTGQPVPTRSQAIRLLVVASGVVLGFPLFSAWAMQTLPASHGGVILGIMPLATALIGALLSGERPSSGFWTLSLVGSAIVVAYSLSGGMSAFEFGDLTLLGAILTAAVGYAVGGRMAREMGGWQVICWALAISFPLVLPAAWAVAPAHWNSTPVAAWLGLLYLSLGSQLFGFFLWNAGLARGGVARVSQVQLLQPFLTIGASALLLGEAIEGDTLFTALAVFGVVAFGRAMPIAQRAPEPVCLSNNQPMRSVDQ